MRTCCFVDRIVWIWERHARGEELAASEVGMIEPLVQYIEHGQERRLGVPPDSLPHRRHEAPRDHLVRSLDDLFNPRIPALEMGHERVKVVKPLLGPFAPQYCSKFGMFRVS